MSEVMGDQNTPGTEQFDVRHQEEPFDDMREDEVVTQLNELLQVNHDARAGYQLAAEETESDMHERFFDQMARQRARFISELNELVVRYGGDPEDDGSIKGAFHRAWIDIRTAVNESEGAILAECDRGEEAALETYKEVMTHNLPADVHKTVEGQFQELKKAHDYVHNAQKVVQT